VLSQRAMEAIQKLSNRRYQRPKALIFVIQAAHASRQLDAGLKLRVRPEHNANVKFVCAPRVSTRSLGQV